MLATRVIPVLLWGEHGAVKGRQFSKDRGIGSIKDRLRLIEKRDVDELILLDIAATPNNRSPRFEEIKALCENLFCPVTVGGGIRNLNDIRRLLAGGADKVSIKTAAIKTPELIEEAARKFGSQSIVVSIDVDTGSNRKASSFAQEMEARGAGEILLQSIERDGTQAGYDLDLISAVASAVSIPVIAAGGCGSYEHMAQALRAGAHAVASGAMFQFREATPKGAARYLREQGFVTRI